MIVNLNILCKLQLNDYGKQVWLSQFECLPDDIKQSRPDILETLKSAIDDNGVVQTTLWEAMAIFGPFITMTNSPFASPTVQLMRNINFITGEIHDEEK